jgi:pantoate--beta-alanine ligase
MTRIRELRTALARYRSDGERIALVPTMGALHDGHLSLVDEARRRAERVVMSVFVNPLQFGPADDFARYPRDIPGDAAKAASRGVDLLFTPSPEEVYPAPPVVQVVPRGLDARWEGEIRPGHFAGVLTVVAKLFNIVQPDVAVFGQKDMQQVTIVRAMARDLDFPVEVAVAPTMREPDGLAMSSRNAYLSPEERVRALSLSRALRAVRQAWSGRGERDAGALAALGRAEIEREDGVRLDYLALVDADRLEPVEVADASTRVIVAARVGATRLLDNIILGAPVRDDLGTEPAAAAAPGGA